jgi:hypothetical protein
LVCRGGGIVCDAEPGDPEPETCGGNDRDCDGRLDEGFDLGGGCQSGEGACRRAGQLVCGGDGGAVCDAIPGLPAPEACEGTDQDCDGVVDEGFNVGVACQNGVGTCIRAGRLVCDINGLTECDAQPGNPQAETCDGADQDCDGRTDEGFNLGQACLNGFGLCRRAGLLICGADGQAVCNAQPGNPQAEICDTLDQDCDDRIDEGFNLGQACQNGVGLCRRNGVNVCGGGQAICSAQPGNPQVETCNGIDQDCDGQVDEGFNLGAACQNGLGACVRNGTFVCEGGLAVCSAQPGAPQGETCEGTDQDCDGRVDEGLSLGVACQNGAGVCMRDGQLACDANGQVVCNAQPGNPQEETCDNSDQDCDGRVDEDFNAGAACQRGIGACNRVGQLACDASGQAVCNAQPGIPQAETCEGTDQDCDGRTDEGCLIVGAGERHTCVVRMGSMKCWGGSVFGETTRPVGAHRGRSAWRDGAQHASDPSGGSHAANRAGRRPYLCVAQQWAPSPAGAIRT